MFYLSLRFRHDKNKPTNRTITNRHAETNRRPVNAHAVNIPTSNRTYTIYIPPTHPRDKSRKDVVDVPLLLQTPDDGEQCFPGRRPEIEARRALTGAPPIVHLLARHTVFPKRLVATVRRQSVHGVAGFSNRSNRCIFRAVIGDRRWQCRKRPGTDSTRTRGCWILISEVCFVDGFFYGNLVVCVYFI